MNKYSVEVAVNVLPRTFHFAAVLWASHESCCEQVRGPQEWATPGDLVYGRTTHQKAMVVGMAMMIISMAMTNSTRVMMTVDIALC